MMKLETGQSLGAPSSIQWKEINVNTFVSIALVSFLVVSASAPALANDPPPARGGHMGPPREAFEACKGKSEGSAVEFTNRRGEKVKATCTEIDGQLRAVPEGGPSGPMGMPPDATRDQR